MKRLWKFLRRCVPIVQTLALAGLLVSSARALIVQEPKPVHEEPKPLPLYSACVEGTIVSPYLLRAIARAESDEIDAAVGDGGLSHGRFQLNERYHAERAAAWGEYDPHDPAQAGRIAARYLEACLLAFPGDIERAVCAYRQGIHGVKRDGATRWYFERVRGRI